MNVEGQYNPKDVECIPVENLEVLPSGADWQSRHLESERRKAEIRDRIHKQAEQGQKTAKDYFRPAKPTPSIYDSDLKRVAVYARVSTSSEEQISSIENQTLYYTKKIAETENWNLQDIYSDEGKSGTSLRKRDAFKRMMRDAKDQKMDLIICASISRYRLCFFRLNHKLSILRMPIPHQVSHRVLACHNTLVIRKDHPAALVARFPIRQKCLYIEVVLAIRVKRVDIFGFKIHTDGMCRVHGFQGRDLRHAI